MLIGAGHRGIAFLAGLPGSWATRARLRGFRRALVESGIDPHSQPVRHGNFRADSGYQLAREVLAVKRRPTALLCGNDRMAMGAYLALGELGLRIPRDLSVMGFDDQDGLAADIHPALTTIRLPYYEMGAWAAGQLFPRTQAPNIGQTYLPCPVVLRDSVGPPPKSGR